MNLLKRLGIEKPIIQAPMAGVSTPDMAAAVSNAGALGSISAGATDAESARTLIDAVREKTARPFNVNVFVHATPKLEPEKNKVWLGTLRPAFAKFDAEPPDSLQVIYQSFTEDDAMFETLLDTAPAVISFHFGLPNAAQIRALKTKGCSLIASATNLHDAQQAEAAGMDAIIAQGIEAGGHRGCFDPDAPDEELSTRALTRLLVRELDCSVIAAGGIMDGGGIAAALANGAEAAQLGTAFIACPESSADDGYRAALQSPLAAHTRLTRAISGRPARCLANAFVEAGFENRAAIPDYPIAYDAGKALNAAAKAKGEFGYGAQWAGEGAAQCRVMPAAELVETLHAEMIAAQTP